MTEVSMTVATPANELSGTKAMEMLSERLKTNLSSYFPGCGADATITGTPIGGQFAKTFKFDITSGTRQWRAFAKICPVFERLDPARMEYETLVLLYKAMPKADPGLATPRPIAYYPEINGYVQESVGVETFRDLLLRKNSRLASADSVAGLVEKLRGSARWLHTFHDITASGRKPFDAAAFIQSILDECDYRKMGEFGFKRSTVEGVYRVFSSLPSLGSLSVPYARSHWDYTPGHVFLDNGRFSVIDILGLEDTPVYDDVGRFMAALTSVNSLPKYPLFDYARAATLFCDEFTKAYLNGAGIKTEEGRLLANVYRLKHLIFYFNGQYTLISQRLHPFAASVYMRLKGIRIFEGPILNAIREIDRGLSR